MKYLSDKWARVTIRPWSDPYTYEYRIHNRKEFGPYLTGLVHVDRGNLSMDEGHLQNLKDVKIIESGLKLVLEYFASQYPADRYYHPSDKDAISLGDEVKKRVMDNSMKNAKRKINH